MGIDLRLGNCLELIKQIPDKSVDLIVTDPPYELETTGGGNDRISVCVKRLGKELSDAGLMVGLDNALLPEFERVCKVFNAYIWCSRTQLPKLLDYFVTKQGYLFQVLIWNKTNPIPANNHTYLNDKEYCLYFRNRGGYFQPTNIEAYKSVWIKPINAADKKAWGHPTIKPLEIIETLVLNSSREGETILDPFMGSGTTGVACARHNRNFIGMEINEKYFNTAKQRINSEQAQLKLF